MSGYRYETPYVFHEYPKWVTPPDGEPVIVQDAEEEAAVMASEPAKRRGRPPGSVSKPKVSDDGDGTRSDIPGA